VIAEAHRREWALVLAATVRVARDLDLAEECVQEAYASALQTWVRSGIPRNPAAWLTTTAKRRAIDAIRRDATGCESAFQAAAAGGARGSSRRDGHAGTDR